MDKPVERLTEAPTDRVIFLDGWRGMAISLVLFGHFVPIPGSDAGRAGVELFFLLSGALMGRLLLERVVPLRRFFLRRIGRVLPGLSAYVAVALLLQIVAPRVFGAVDAGDTASVALFYSNYYFADGHPGIFGHMWSLAIEEHSYVFLGIVAVAARRHIGRSASVGLLAVAAAWGWGAYLNSNGFDYHQAYWRSDVRGASIVIGFTLYLLRSRLINISVGSNAISVAMVQRASLAVATPLLLIRAVPSPLKYTLGTFCCGLLLTSLYHHRSGIVRTLESAPLRWLGKYSYSIYLFQQIFHVVKVELPTVLWPLLGLISIVVGRLGFEFVEKPGQRIVDRITAKFE